MLGQDHNSPATFKLGNYVRIRGERHRSPYSSRLGVVCEIDLKDPRGAYLVRFEDGLRFRYKPDEIEPAQPPVNQNPAA